MPIAFLFLAITGGYMLLVSGEQKVFACTGEWSVWSSCSATCGEGVRTRRRRNCPLVECNDEMDSKHCFVMFCPSYLSWPRIHFSGKLVVDSSTVNNNRCAYHKDFYPSQHSKRSMTVAKTGRSHSTYTHRADNWNPDGTNHVYFIDTKVTSICFGPHQCTIDDPIVGLPVRETTRGVIVALDVDWQRSSELYGFEVSIPGIVKGNFKPVSYQDIRIRFDRSAYLSTRKYAYPYMARYKSKLQNVTWYDKYYGSLFGGNELSITLSMDMFDVLSLHLRVTGTIGMTSQDDPAMMTASRMLQVDGISKSLLLSPAPFHFYDNNKIITIDFSMSIGGEADGNITSAELGLLDLAISSPTCPQCDGTRWEKITKRGKISQMIGNSSRWYNVYGGILDIDLSHLDPSVLTRISKSRIGILNERGDVYMSEFPLGLSYGFTDWIVQRLNVGESRLNHVFVSSYGRPAINAQVNVYPSEGGLSEGRCPLPRCNSTQGIPVSSIGISSNNDIVNQSGMSVVNVTAMSDPGNIRGCGLDGQVYPLKLFIRYRNGKKTWTFSDSPFVGFHTYPYNAEYETSLFASAVQIYHTVPENPSPSWDDVKDIFFQYYNLYPVMWKYGIIDLHSYDDIRKNSRMLYESLFNTDFTNPRYMPVTRDLSAGKQALIKNWMIRGMPKVSARDNDQCTDVSIKRGVGEVQVMLQHAIMLEFSTIPVYMNAWFSLKTEFGRNKEVADILRSIFVEEMLHMTLAANLLNSIGGSVNLTNERTLPTYPTLLSVGNQYQLLPNIELALAPFSIGFTDQVLSRIERPSRSKAKEIINHLGVIWQRKYANSTSVGTNMDRLLQEIKRLGNVSVLKNRNYEEISESAEGWRSVKSIVDGLLNDLDKVNVKFVDGFYGLIALKLASLESCAKLSFNSKAEYDTIFKGDPIRQFNMSQWYEKSFDSILHIFKQDGISRTNPHSDSKESLKLKSVKPPLFKVTDLESALEAIVEIIYQGEGGSECSPLVPDTDVYASSSGRDRGYELSHYYRLREIVHGRKLMKTRYYNSSNHPCIDEFITSSCSTMSQHRYCYVGESIPFYPDGVWPILFNPNDHDYVKDTKAHRLNEQFNLLYTRLLFCLQDAFTGRPESLRKCMSIMHDLTITGKRLAQTPLQNPELEQSRFNGAPTWNFVREKWYRAGLTLRI